MFLLIKGLIICKKPVCFWIMALLPKVKKEQDPHHKRCEFTTGIT
jgi:hypothetical protein